jgi:hypothetical protein
MQPSKSGLVEAVLPTHGAFLGAEEGLKILTSYSLPSITTFFVPICSSIGAESFRVAATFPFSVLLLFDSY